MQKIAISGNGNKRQIDEVDQVDVQDENKATPGQLYQTRAEPKAVKPKGCKSAKGSHQSRDDAAVSTPRFRCSLCANFPRQHEVDSPMQSSASSPSPEQTITSSPYRAATRNSESGVQQHNHANRHGNGTFPPQTPNTQARGRSSVNTGSQQRPQYPTPNTSTVAPRPSKGSSSIFPIDPFNQTGPLPIYRTSAIPIIDVGLLNTILKQLHGTLARVQEDGTQMAERQDQMQVALVSAEQNGQRELWTACTHLGNVCKTKDDALQQLIEDLARRLKEHLASCEGAQNHQESEGFKEDSVKLRGDLEMQHAPAQASAKSGAESYETFKSEIKDDVVRKLREELKQEIMEEIELKIANKHAVAIDCKRNILKTLKATHGKMLDDGPDVVEELDEERAVSEEL